MIFNQWKFPECKGYWFLTAISIHNPSVDPAPIISAINEDYKWLLTNRQAWEFFKKRWFIKWIEQVPRLKAKAILNRWIPLIANVAGVDWEKTNKPPYIAVFDRHIGSHNCTIVGYDNKTRLLKIANTYGDEWGENGYYYLHADDLDKVTEFCQIIL